MGIPAAKQRRTGGPVVVGEGGQAALGPELGTALYSTVDVLAGSNSARNVCCIILHRSDLASSLYS